MNKPPLATAISSLLAVSIIITPTLTFAAGAERSAEAEIARRQNYVLRGEQMIESGNLALKARDYERATASYKQACDFIPNAQQTKKSYDRALQGFCYASCKLAEQRIAEGRLVDATNTLQIVIDERYNPRCKEAHTILAHLEEPGYYNKTSGPEFVAKVERVKALFVEAQGFFDTDRFDLAFKRCEQILNLDPFNKAARMFQEKIHKAKSDFDLIAKTERRARAIEEVDRAWRSPVQKFNVTEAIVVETPDSKGPSNISRIQRKLERTIIPKLAFENATIREAVDFLKKKSVELDLDEPKTGVNIVLKLESGSSVAVPDAVLAPPLGGPAAIPGLEAAPAPAPIPAAAPLPTASPSDARITVSLANIPLIEALRYVTNLANLKFKVEPYAVSVVPLSTNTEVLITKEWKVRPDLIPRTPAAGGAAGPTGLQPAGGAAGGDASRGGSGIADRESAKTWLIANGVQFNGQASAVYIVTNSRLIVRNTPDQLELIDTIINQGAVGGPTQVEIEAKFVEITQTNLKELSFDWLLGQANFPATKNTFFGGGTTSNTGIQDPNDFPFVVPGSGEIIGSSPVTSGNRSGNAAISASAIDALLFGTTGSTSKLAPAIGALSGVFTDPQFQLVIRALNQKKGVDLLSSPRVTTKSGQRAVIEIIREFKYPTEFDPPQIPQTFGGGGGGLINPVTGLISGGQSNSFPVTPTTPTAFEVRNTGVTLEVEPVVGPDGYTIDLNLVPQVVEFEGFVNYGSPIQSTQTNPLTGIARSVVLTANTINQPIFSTRKVTTSVSVFDGSTVVIGGLMREDVQKVEDKVPLLGDIPIIGRLFRSSVDQHSKRNLVIFVSARLMKPDGDPVRQDQEKEEVIETLATPDLTIPDLPLMPK